MGERFIAGRLDMPEPINPMEDDQELLGASDSQVEEKGKGFWERHSKTIKDVVRRSPLLVPSIAAILSQAMPQREVSAKDLIPQKRITTQGSMPTMTESNFKVPQDGGPIPEPELPQQGSVEIPPNPEGETAQDKEYKVLPQEYQERTKLPKEHENYIFYNDQLHGYENKKGEIWRRGMSPNVTGIDGKVQYENKEAGWLYESDNHVINAKDKNGKDLTVTISMWSSKLGTGLRDYPGITMGESHDDEITEYLGKFGTQELNGKTIFVDWVPGVYEGFAPFSPDFVVAGFRPDGKTATTAVGFGIYDGNLHIRCWSLGAPEKKWTEKREKYWFIAAYSTGLTMGLDGAFNQDPDLYFNNDVARAKRNSIFGKGEANKQTSEELLEFIKPNRQQIKK